MYDDHVRTTKHVQLPHLTVSHCLIHVLVATLPPLLPLIRSEFHLSYTQVGILSFAFCATLGLGSILSGILSDQFNKLKLIGLGFLFIAVSSALLFLTSNFFSVVIIFILIGLFLSFYHPSALSYIAKFHGNGKAFGLHETGENIGIAIAPAIAGFICMYMEWRFVYVFWAILAIGLSSLFLRKGKRFSSSDRLSLKMFLHLIITSRIRAAYMAIGLFGFIFGGALTFIPIFLVDFQRLSIELAGVITSVFAAGGIIGKLVSGYTSDLIKRQKVIALAFFLSAPFFLLVPFLSKIWSIVALALAGLILPMTLPAVMTTISREAPPSRMGLAYGFLVMMGFGSGSIASIILGPISDFFGVSTIFYPIVIAALFGGVLSITQ